MDIHHITVDGVELQYYDQVKDLQSRLTASLSKEVVQWWTNVTKSLQKSNN